MTEMLTSDAIVRDAAAALVGLCVGSFLNVLALRSLKEQSVFWPPSSCPNCNQRIKIYDLIPVVSYFLLGGKCRVCKTKIHWMYPFVEAFTACVFALLMHCYGSHLALSMDDWQGWGNLIGMATFSSILIAICITDFKEMLIPHEITYPSMLVGLIYSGVVRDDLTGSLIGIGVSYMLFDFIAFYGRLLFIKMHGDPDSPEARRQRKSTIDPDRELEFQVDHAFDLHDDLEDEEEEEFVVMGGADAVLAALISAWLGVQALGIALGSGFLLGTVFGAVYLVVELHKTGNLKKAIKPALIGMALLVALAEGLLYAMYATVSASGTTPEVPFLQMGLVAAACGGLMGVLKSGTGISKPFPFGPALALGAVVAMITKSMIFGNAP